MKRLGWLPIIALVAPAMAFAGPNAGGVLVVHAAPTFLTTKCDYCSLHNTCYDLNRCEDSVVRVSDTRTYVLVVLAAFPPGSSPRMSGVTFGIAYDPALLPIVGDRSCSADFELANSDWPAPNSGTALTWNQPVTSEFTPIYWFATYNYYNAAAQFCITTHVDQGGHFADDSVPAVLDPIADFGCIGFNTDGYLPCPTAPPPTGACCGLNPCGPCFILTADACKALPGVYMGDGTNCDPNPCDCPPPIGACCLPDEICVVLTQEDCVNQGGTFLGETVLCDPNPCQITPARSSTWGRIKRGQRG